MTDTRLVIMVLHGGSVIGRDLALGLADHGAAVGIVGADGSEGGVARAIEAGGGTAVAHTAPLSSRADYDAALHATRAALGPPHAIVAPVLPGTGTARVPLVDATLDQWLNAGEYPLRAARFALQSAFTQLTPPLGTGGRVLLVAPVGALTGEPGLAAYAAAAEGSRAMVRAVARGWGVHGITLHWVGVPTVAFTGEDPASAPRLAMWEPALGRAPGVRAEVAPVVAALVSSSSAFTTGTTTIVDGGLTMPT